LNACASTAIGYGYIRSKTNLPRAWQPRYNIAPRQEHFIVTTKYENREVARAKWGLLSRAANDGREKCLINAKAETVETEICPGVYPPALCNSRQWLLRMGGT
jgi:putative SOS response-associated peptidase YedK